MATKSKNVLIEKVSELAQSVARMATENEHRSDISFLFLKKLKQVIDFDAATIYQYSEITRELEKVASVGSDVELLESLALDMGTGLSAWTADSNEPILIADRTKKRRFNPEEDYACFLSAPLVTNDELLGVLNFGSHTPNKFDDTDIVVLKLVSAIYLPIKKLEQQKKYQKELEQSLDIFRDEITSISKKSIDINTVEKIAKDTSAIIHGINNSLSIVLGNIQCILLSKDNFNQKTMARIKRIEEAAKRITESNQQILKLHNLVDPDDK